MLLSAMPGSSADEQITHFMTNKHADYRIRQGQVQIEIYIMLLDGLTFIRILYLSSDGL